MTDMQQNLAGMNDLNERVQNAEARSTQAERQAQATQQELAQSQAGVKGRGRRVQQCHYNRSKGSARLRRNTSLSRVEGEDDKWREWARVFRSRSGRFFGGALAEIYEHIEAHRNESATILDLALTSLRFYAGLLRKIFTELYHVLIMLSRGRAQRLVLKVKEPEGLEAYRLLFRRYEPVSTVTTVSKLVDLLATTCHWSSFGLVDRY